MAIRVMETAMLHGPKVLAVILRRVMMMLYIIWSARHLTGACGYALKCQFPNAATGHS